MAEYFYGRCYKYRRFGQAESAEREHLTDLIVRQRMMFSSPSSFNDPYDCHPIFTTGNPAEDRGRVGRAWEEGRKRAGHRKPSRQEREQHISQVMAQLSTHEGAAAHFKPFLDRGTGVFCMSKDWRLLTQWAYYADDGKGLCLEYDVQPGMRFDRIYEVQYQNQRPQVHVARLLDDERYRSESLFSAVITKANDWQHEQEVRALSMEPGIIVHPPGMLVSINIGIAAEDQDVAWLIDVLSASSLEIPIYKTKLSADSFTLQRYLI